MQKGGGKLDCGEGEGEDEDEEGEFNKIISYVIPQCGKFEVHCYNL